MPKYVPEWARGKYRIVACDDGQWMVQEKGMLFWRTWESRVELGWPIAESYYSTRKFPTIEDAKTAIDDDILRFGEYLRRKKWYKQQETIFYP